MTLTFHNDPAAKAIRIERCKAHMEADRLRAGTYGEMSGGKFTACAIGCQIFDIAHERGVDWRELPQGSHNLVAQDYGWPVWLCYLEDTIFENLTPEDRPSWPLRLVEAVPVGRDISKVRHQLLAFIAREIVSFDKVKFPDVAAVNERVAILHERAAAGETISTEEWSAAARAAESAAASAAWSAARSAARSAAIKRISEELLRLLAAA